MLVPRVKGTNVLGAVKGLRANPDRARQLLPNRLHHYLQDRILPSSWYPEGDQIELLRVVSSFMPPEPNPLLVMGRMAATIDLTTVYRGHVRPGDPQRTLSSCSALWRSYHDTGEMSASDEGENAVLVHLRGYRAACREMCLVTQGYLLEAAVQAGAHEPRIEKVTCCVHGAPECCWRLAWK
jgi:hypothetical protein